MMWLLSIFVCGFYLTYCNSYDCCKTPETDLCQLFPKPCYKGGRHPEIKNCPGNIFATADRGMLTKAVYWNEPSAIDDEDGSVKLIMITSGSKMSGDTFEKYFVIGYFARDSDGNTASCSFTISVTVVHCPSLRLSHAAKVTCNHGDERYGTVCHIDCRSGFSRIGVSQIECQANGEWSDIIPTCIAVRCPALPPKTKTLNYACTAYFEFGSECLLLCLPGFVIPQGESRVKLCRSDGKWQGSFPKCIDKFQPEISHCVPFAYGIADENSTSGIIDWKEPTVFDNDKSTVLKRSSNIFPGDRIEAGTHRVTYSAIDQAKNTARPCTVTLLMKVLSCPRLYNNYYMSVTCPWGYQYGGECQFSCRNGSELIGTNTSKCIKIETDIYARWDFDEQPYCKVHRRCVDLPSPPKNGAVVCDTWLDGRFCQVQCQNGYDFQPGYRFYDILVCGGNGQWEPEDVLPIPDCSKTYMVKEASFKLYASFYYDGDCTDPVVQQSIRKNNIDDFPKSKFNYSCSQYKSQCRVENVQIICGARNRKRSAEMKITMDIVIDSEEFQTDQSFMDIQSSMMSALSNESSNGSFEITLGDNITLKATDLTAERVAFKCSNNTFPSYTTSSCVECPAGTHYSTSLQTCLQCPKGHYQPLEGQPECLQCPDETTTEQIGAKYVEECLESCLPGYWSQTGVTPCSPCPQGSHAEDYGSSVCVACPSSQTTLMRGSSNASDCTHFDIFLSSNVSKAIMDIDFAQEKTGIILSAWLRFPVGSNTTSPSLQFHKSESWFKTIWVKHKYMPDSGNNFSVTIDHKDWTFVLYSINLEEFSRINESTSKLKITGPLIVSQLNIWSSNYTEGEIHNRSHHCIINETGDILPWKDWEMARLEGSFIQIPSLCDDTNECDEHPCGDNTCFNELDGFSCVCKPGYRGQHCEENINECLTNICLNNSTCVDKVNEYMCVCPPNYKGKFCEFLFLNGNWGKWDEWSSCSETCGNGTKTRKRYCNNPAPYNGGHICSGNDTEITDCFVEDCPVCTILEAPSNGSLNCTGSPETGFNCSISCNRGFDFDEGVKPFYECGPNTFFLWDFKTSDNPDGNLPTCNPTKESEELSASFMVLYEDLHCDEQNRENIKSEIEAVVGVFLEEIPCTQRGTCNVSDVNILSCGKESTRKKRSVEEKQITAGFNVKFMCSTIQFDSELCVKDLIDAVRSFKNSSLIHKLSVNVSETTYEIDVNQTGVRGEVRCDTGYISSGVYCVPCGVGNFFANGECNKCEYGFYQNELAQTVCKSCPTGTTTPGRASRGPLSCSVMMILQENHDELYTGVGLSIGTLIVVVAIVAALIFKFRNMEFKLGQNGVKVQKKYSQVDAFNFNEQEVEGVALCTIKKTR
ncbi:sushi, von Willebrand factor type A, EGF and pentraxin domain-containing protein 1-like isoform X1 [Ostrea edulis]|uniref:sushi, von Willebrand factor type A, EGF and pentraxin domain-containing protein 1-like isoform X1 n=1 Tax=Ostrea edulis TaxID=37623 RepID=UPI0024AE9EC0|nr:sushi, von Willebrand factor type A, EGF and pentraxin domain-containing protein 1-like isoform X1 [Ostrea edulis]